VAIDPNQMDGPIPGENYTSDTKNYPWHRPPEYTTLDEAIEASFKKLTEENAAYGVLTMLEMGMTVADMTETFLMSGIGAGKWTPDFALLMAGPISHIIYLMAKGYDIDCDMGIDNSYKGPTTAFFKATLKDKKRIKEATKDIDVEAIKGAAPRGGFMGMQAREETDTVASGDVQEYEQPQMGAKV
jgi:hypothetical protein